MTKISLKRIEASIAELEAGKGVVPRAELEALRKENAALKMHADKLAAALEWCIPRLEWYWKLKGPSSALPAGLRADLAEYQAHKGKSE